MRKHTLLIFAVLTAAILCNCIDATTIIAVKKDGSGLVMETVYVNPAIQMMMQQMMGSLAKSIDVESDEDKPATLPLEIEKYKEKATRMGSGVTFVSAKETQRKDGAPGIEVIYAFEDIRTLKWSEEPENPTSESMGPMMASEPNEEDNRVTFNFIPGATSKLIIQLPEDKDEELDPIKTDETSQKPEMELGQAEMAKQFLQGFRARAMIRLVDGHIVKTNASYVKKVKGNDYVTLFDMNMGELLKTEEKLQQFQSLDEIRDISTARKLLKGVPGFQIEPADRIEIQFR